MSLLSKAAIALALFAATPAFAFTSQPAPPLADGASPFANSDAAVDSASSTLQDSIAEQDLQASGSALGYAGGGPLGTSSQETAHLGPVNGTTGLYSGSPQNGFGPANESPPAMAAFDPPER